MLDSTMETICGHYGEEEPAAYNAVIPPLFQNSLHTFNSSEEFLHQSADAYLYGRIANPTTALLEAKINALEHGAGCLCFGSGMAAISSAILHYVKPHGHIVAVRNCYGTAHTFMQDYLSQKMDIETTFVEGKDPADFENAVRDNTQLFYLESPSSAVFSLQDLPAVAKIAKARGIRTIIDNSWASPIFQNPIDMGIDVVVHTLSKYIGGHSDIIAGAAVFADRADYEAVQATERALLGGINGSFESWLGIRGIRTLPVRLRQHQENAMIIADRLYRHPKIKKVLYPGHPSFDQYELARKQMRGFSGLMSFIPDCTPDQTLQILDRLQIIRIGVSWGGFESLTVPSMYGLDEAAAKALGGDRSMIRLFVGQENVEDLWGDLENALSILK